MSTTGRSICWRHSTVSCVSAPQRHAAVFSVFGLRHHSLPTRLPGRRRTYSPRTFGSVSSPSLAISDPACCRRRLGRRRRRRPVRTTIRSNTAFRRPTTRLWVVVDRVPRLRCTRLWSATQTCPGQRQLTT